MRVTVSEWLDAEFVEIGCEARAGDTPRAQAIDAFARTRDALGQFGLTLADVVRNRIFGADAEARDAASAVRAETLVGPARAATSSYTAPGHFASPARVALETVAVRPRPGCAKVIRENEPPRLPCRYLTMGPLLVLSGQTAVLPTLEAQVTTNILPRITDYLAEANSGWHRVAHVACVLHRSQKPDEMRALFRRMVPVAPARLDIRFVDGYSAAGKLVEIEVTAERDV